MPSKSFTAAVQAVRKNLSVYTSARAHKLGEPNPTTLELLSGAEFIGLSAVDDLVTYVSPLLEKSSPHKLPRPLIVALRAVRAKVTLFRIRDVEQQCEEACEAADAGRLTLLSETRVVIEDLQERCAIYAAAIGCPRAAQKCATLCAKYVRSRNMRSFVDVITYGLMKSMLDYLVIGSFEEPENTESDTYIPESRFIQLTFVEGLARGFAHVISVVNEAVEQGDPVTPPPPDDDMQSLASLVSEDRAEIVRRPAEAKHAPLEDPKTWSMSDLPPGLVVLGPGLVVIRDVGHVKRGKGNDHDPVKEASPLIDVRTPLVMPPHDLTKARAELLAEFPQAVRVVDRILTPLATQDTIRLPHVLLWGPPGGGKTRFARRLGEVLELQPAVLSMAGATDPLAITGTARGWSTGGFSLPVREMLRARIANPMIVIDEADKIGSSRHNGNAADALINLLGGETAARYRDIYLQADVDASRVQWILTANGLDTIPRPLLDRCLVLRFDEPGPEHLRTLATSILDDVRADRGLDETWAPGFDGVEWAALEAYWPGGSLRALRRLVETVLDARESGQRQ